MAEVGNSCSAKYEVEFREPDEKGRPVTTWITRPSLNRGKMSHREQRTGLKEGGDLFGRMLPYSV